MNISKNSRGEGSARIERLASSNGIEGDFVNGNITFYEFSGVKVVMPLQNLYALYIIANHEYQKYHKKSLAEDIVKGKLNE